MFDPEKIVAFGGLVLGFGFIIFVHELGHFLVAKWVGIRCTQFAIGFGHAMVCWRKGIGLRRGTTEQEFERQINEYLDGRLQSSSADQKDSEPESDDDGKTSSKDKKPKYTSQQIDEAAQKLGLGETEYRLNWMPLGGYVKMLGQEDLDPAARSDDPRSYNNKSVSARMAVISAGVVMNMIFGLLFFIVAFMAGVAFPPNIVGRVMKDGPADKVYAIGHPNEQEYRGLRPGDKVILIDGETVEDFMGIQMPVGLSRENARLKFTIERKDQTLEYVIIPEAGPKQIDGVHWIGIDRPRSVKIGKPIPGSTLPKVLTKAGIGVGWYLDKINGKQVDHYYHFEGEIAKAKGDPVSLTFVDSNNQTKKVTLDLAADPMLMGRPDLLPHLWGMNPPFEIGGIAKNRPAETAGLEKGDVLVQIGPASWPDYAQVVKIAGEGRGRAQKLVVLRDGKHVELKNITPGDDGKLGVGTRLHLSSNIIARVEADSPLAKFRLLNGSRIVEIEGHKIANYAQLQRVLSDIASETLKKNPDPQDKSEAASTAKADDSSAVADKAKKPAGPPLRLIKMTFESNVGPKLKTETHEVPLSRADAKLLAAVGWRVPISVASSFDMLEIPVKANGPWEATLLGVEKTHMFMMQTYLTLIRLIQGDVPVGALRGPLGIADMGTQIAHQKGWTYLLFFLGLISINLVVINFLPIPIVDGGHMVFLIIEKIKGSPVSVRIQTAATIIGLVMIASIFLFVTYKDVLRYFTSG